MPFDNARISVVIITKGRKGSLEKCVNVLSQASGLQVVIVANGYNKETFEYLRILSVTGPMFKCVFFENKISKSEARNTGITNSGAELIYFLDDDCYPDFGNIALLEEKFKQRADIDIIGGPNVTPPGSPLIERIAGYAFSEIFTAWKMRERFMPGETERVCDDSSVTLCNLAFRRKIFESSNIYFDGRLHYNEENLLLEQFFGKGHKALYCPKLVVYHHRRKDLFSLAEQVYRSGEGRAMMTKIMPKSLRPVYLLPTFFVIYLCSTGYANNPLYLAPLYAYIIFALTNAASIMIKYGESITALPLLIILPFVAHLAYGIGFARGVFKKWTD